MKTILMILSLTLCSKVMADTPNIFNKNRMSSDSMISFVQGCQEAAMKGKPASMLRQVQIFCGCVSDGIQENAYSPEISKICVDVANRYAKQAGKQ